MVWATAGIRKCELYRTLVRHVAQDAAYCHLVARTVTITAGYIAIATRGLENSLGERLSTLLVAYRRHVYIVLNYRDEERKFIY